MDQFRIHTNWTNSVSKKYDFKLEDLRDANVREQLKWVFSDPERLRPGQTRQALTEEAAAEFAKLAQRLRDRGHDAETVAHFINRLVFCMFAEDVDLLPNGMFKRMLEHAQTSPQHFQELATDLFRAMKSGGRVGFEQVAWFNGGLFNDDVALPLDADDLKIALGAARLDWAEVDPSILGTLFERGLDPGKRSQLGAHYTDREKIMMIVDPVVVRPWLAEWDAAKAQIANGIEKSRSAKSASARTKAHDQAVSDYRAFLNRLRAFRVLDPACGSGNFLYLALLALKDVEHRISIEAEAMGLQREFSQVGPASVKGIEINGYAAELARVSVWVGEIQWMRRNGFGVSDHPILKPLDTIECRDAILNDDGSEAKWPQADVVIGNPPFLGGKLLRAVLGDGYVDNLFSCYDGRVPAEADLVTYWLAKTWEVMRAGDTCRAGLVTTNSIRGGANRRVLEPIAGTGHIFSAWDDEAWVVEGAAVRVSLICFEPGRPGISPALNGKPVPEIYADLTGAAVDLTKAAGLVENRSVAFMGDTKGGAFDVDGVVARGWLKLPLNPNGKPNSEVLRPWVNGMDVTRRSAGKWIVDFGWTMSDGDASLYAAPFAHVEASVKPIRAQNRREAYRKYWWRHVEPRQGMWAALKHMDRFIVTPTVSKHRIFAWLQKPICADHQLIVIARDDDTAFGILNSRFHEVWALGLCTWLGVGNDPRYTPSTTFETFPFPEGLTPDRPAASYADDPRALKIATAAAHLNALRERWLNPSDLVRIEPEVVPGFPDRLIPVSEEAEKTLKKRSLTNLYNERPTWLVNAHAELDAAVAAAYGWPADISEEEALARLFTLNQKRAAAHAALLPAK
ncbi:class I SAM-dependent DNA methyltransferase [Bradyrhizobium sp. CCBAU 11386]|uniref:class I SAM-dependent DNA methyltransferase n=1 Tax=Bradyrhizobium sp. CCBAU 11386 TaxID=1630837 RepID=UPI002304ACF5|nr:class I SAM-dependent DNA methyltransferase [Bradyrhizobium sp. CCBAU 11386]